MDDTKQELNLRMLSYVNFSKSVQMNNIKDVENNWTPTGVSSFTISSIWCSTRLKVMYSIACMYTTSLCNRAKQILQTTADTRMSPVRRQQILQTSDVTRTDTSVPSPYQHSKNAKVLVFLNSCHFLGRRMTSQLV